MKKIYFTLVAFLVLQAFPVMSQQTFKVSFGGNNNNEYHYDFKKMTGDRYLVTGVTDSYGAGNADAYCIMLNAQGEMLWSKTYGTTSLESYTKCYGTSDNGFLLSFSSDGGRNGKDTGAFIIKCDKKGNIEWSKFIKNEMAFVYRPASMYEDKNGNYYLLYDWNTNRYYGETFAVVKMNKSGNILWNKIVDAEPFSDFTSIQISQAYNGDIIVCGYGSGDNWSTYGSVIHLYLFSKEYGSIKTCSKISVSDCYYCELLVDNIVVRNKQLWVTGNYYYNTVNYTCWFEITKKDGKLYAKAKAHNSSRDIQYLINNKKIEQPATGFSKELIFLKDGSYMRAYRYTVGAPTYYDIIVNKYDSQGRTCPGHNEPNIDTTIRNLTLHISDKSYSVLDNKITIQDYPVTVTNVTESRTFCSGTADYDSTEKEENVNVLHSAVGVKTNLYPNPAGNVIHVNFEASKSSVISLAIFNAEGKQVFSKASYFSKGTQQTTVDIQSLKPGVYYLKILSDTPAMIKFIKS